MKRADFTDKQALLRWNSYIKNLKKETPLPVENEAQKAARQKRLKADVFEWMRYYFPHYYKSELAYFHKRFINETRRKDNIYIVNAWAREHAKTAISMMLKIRMMLDEEINNVLFVSWSFDNAVDLLTPMLLELANNQRIINDYGVQRNGLEVWDFSRGKWKLANGASIRAIGAGQSPRGTRNEEKRPDWLEFDDVDTEDVCRNEKRLQKLWDWVERAAIPAMSIDNNKRIVFSGNIIAKDSAIVRAIKQADYHQVVNILNDKGIPTWKERFSQKDIDYMLSKMSYNAAQQEYFNNPIVQGSVFKEIIWGKCPPLNQVRMLIAYGDPSPSNSETKKNSNKALTLVGKKNGVYYVYKVFLEQTNNATFINWYHQISEQIGGKVPVYNYMENNSLQNPFYEQVYVPLMHDANEQHKASLMVMPDQRGKPDKYTRIEGTLEPLHRTGSLVFNEKEKENPHMKRMEAQMKNVEPTLASNVDGPDALEGAVYILDKKIRALQPGNYKVGKTKKKSSKRY